MKVIVTLILVVLIVTGGIWLFKNFMAPAEKKANNFVEQVKPSSAPTEPAKAEKPEVAANEQVKKESEEAAPPKPERSAANPGDLNLSTAGTPVAKSRLGRKINHIYSDHNKGLDEAANAD